jgi:hypothetical protein
MAGLLDKPDTAQAPPTPPAADGGVRVPDDASRLCVNCAALLAEGQDWCLECGTAQPGRIGGRPGWRPALTIVAVTAVLAVGAVAAAYAALSSDAERRASAPPPPSAAPVTPPAPAPTSPAPAEETPSVAAPDDSAPDPPADDAPKDDGGDSGSDPTPAPSGGSGTDTDAGGDSGGDTGGSNPGTGGDTGTGQQPRDEKPKSPVIALGPDAASTFDPHDRAGGLTGDPADAIDGRPKTAWEAPVGQDGLVNIGLLVSLERAKAIDKVRLRAGTPGFNVELYGSKLGTPPEHAPGATKYWRKLDETRDFGTDEKLDAGGERFRHVLLWFTEQPADTKVMIPEVELLR